jgi:sulfatase modifying factor 1
MRINASLLPFLVATSVFGLACTAAAIDPPRNVPLPPPPPPPLPAVTIALTPPPAPTTDPSTSPTNLVASAPATPTGPAACPADMKLVDGDYCTEVEHKCKKSWFDKSNKKVVCEEFEPVATCIGERVKKRYCVDTYEWPNQKGVRPEVMNRFHQAQIKCASVGKRMCTESEWNFACEGPRHEAVSSRVCPGRSQVQRRPYVGWSEHEESRQA